MKDFREFQGKQIRRIVAADFEPKEVVIEFEDGSGLMIEIEHGYYDDPARLGCSALNREQVFGEMIEMGKMTMELVG